MELIPRPGDVADPGGTFFKEPVQLFNPEIPAPLVLSDQRLNIGTYQAIKACIPIYGDLFGPFQYVVVDRNRYVCHFTLTPV
jgi:hypothetical protein